MKCQSCQKNGDILVHKIVYERSISVSYCRECAQKKGLILHKNFISDFSALEEFEDFCLNKEENLSGNKASLADACPQCKLAFSLFLELGLLGCPQCVQAFAPYFDQEAPLLPWGGLHLGSAPASFPPATKEYHHFIELQNSIALALEKNDYPSAQKSQEELLAFTQKHPELQAPASQTSSQALSPPPLSKSPSTLASWTTEAGPWLKSLPSSLAFPKKGTSTTPFVLRTQISLSRNLAGQVFPSYSDSLEREIVLGEITQAIEKRELFEGAYFQTLDAMNRKEKVGFGQMGLLSKALVARSQGCALILAKKEPLALAINGQSHLKEQVFLPSQNIDLAWQKLQALDQLFLEQLDIAYSPERGFLSAQPKYWGNGWQANLLLHLPALAKSPEKLYATQALNALGLSLLPLFPKDSESMPFFVLKNLGSLGKTEACLLELVKQAAEELCQQEKQLRQQLLLTPLLRLKEEDALAQTIGQLSQARFLSLEQGVTALSRLLWGENEGLLTFEEENSPPLSSFLGAILSGFLPQNSLPELSSSPLLTRAALRAQLLRQLSHKCRLFF